MENILPVLAHFITSGFVCRVLYSQSQARADVHWHLDPRSSLRIDSWEVKYVILSLGVGLVRGVWRVRMMGAVGDTKLERYRRV